MTVEELKVIDAVGVEEASGEVVLLISDHLDWEDEKGHLAILKDKLNSYLAFIESEELLAKYPRAIGRRARIEVVFRAQPPRGALAFLEAAHDTVQAAGIGLRWRMSSSAS